ncbi:o-succinylbenzoate--CoA ligase [Halobacteriales archaeon QS_1_68_17]|nr:MAG: o-succinylbenzoate--CoA ligase [Halobacteriales archaeon QS_1_68_17]
MDDWLAHRVRASPDATALVDAGTGEQWRYDALDEAVSETAGRLRVLGIGPGDHLGVLVGTRVGTVRLIHAAMRIGAVLVPLSARLTAGELAPQIDRADVTALVCERDTEAVAVDAADVPVASVDPPSAEGVSRLDAVDPAAADRDRGEPRDANWTWSDPLAILWTSGTTGEPKPVVLTAGNLLASAGASAARLGVLPEDRWFLCLPTYHMGGLAPVVRSTLYGTTLVLQEGFDAESTLAAMATHEPTGVSLVPTQLRRLLDAGSLPDSLRFVLLGGAPAPGSLIRECADRDVPVCPTYGMTETASQIATARPEAAFAEPGTVGRPLVFTDVTVVDESGDPVPDSTAGELVVDGPTVSPGYYGAPEVTAAARCAHGLRTGDVGYRDADGRLRVLNRKDDRILTGGETVDPGEVIDVLRSHPAVDAAAVVGVPDPEWGERVVALVVPAGEDAPSAERLRDYCRERLAGYKRPKAVGFAGELPRTASGTVDRERVRSLFAGGE